jgi:hypothetical protein
MTEHVQMPHGPMRLETDLQIVLHMLNEGRRRSLQSAFGITREEADLVSLVLLGMIGHSVHRRWTRFMSGPLFPSAGDSALSVAATRELVQTIAGPASRDTSMFGTLVAVAAAGGVALPIVRRGMRAVEVSVEDVAAAFRHRYGIHAARAAAVVSQITPGVAPRQPPTEK